jgi:hypothetical protein
VVVRAGRRAADAVVVLVGIRHLVIRGAEHASVDDVGGDHLNHNAGDDDHVDTTIDNRLAHDHVHEYFDHDDRGSITGHRDSCHRSVGAGTRHHRLSHG